MLPGDVAFRQDEQNDLDESSILRILFILSKNVLSDLVRLVHGVVLLERLGPAVQAGLPG